MLEYWIDGPKIRCARRGQALEFSMKSGLLGGRENVAVQTCQVLATRAVQISEIQLAVDACNKHLACSRGPLCTGGNYWK